jgi:uncharacterized membrane protein YdjX (TVP38/TMEM64 family)
LAALVVLLAAFYLLGRAAGLTEGLSPRSMQATLQAAGLAGMLAFVALFAVSNLVQLPGMIFVVGALLVFGGAAGSGLAMVGALVAVSVSFWTVRLVGGQPLTLVQKPWLRRWLDRVERQPVRTIVVLRLVAQLSPPINVALAFSSIRYRDYLLGTALGMAPVIAAVALGLRLFGAGP